MRFHVVNSLEYSVIKPAPYKKLGRDSMTNTKEIASKRRSIDPATCERDYDSSEVEFMQALEKYKSDSGRRFPTCSEILIVLRSLGYVRVMPCSLSAD